MSKIVEPLIYREILAVEKPVDNVDNYLICLFPESFMSIALGRFFEKVPGSFFLFPGSSPGLGGGFARQKMHNSSAGRIPRHSFSVKLHRVIAGRRGLVVDFPGGLC